MRSTLHATAILLALTAISILQPRPATAAEAESAVPHHHADHATAGDTGSPALSLPGDDTFGALAEAASALRESAGTDWTRVDLDALREHLVDMHRVSAQAGVEKQRLADGFRALVTGNDERTVAAIRRMVPAHARMMQGHRGWRVEVEEIERGVRVTVRAGTGSDGPGGAAEAERLRGLGFFGFLVSGEHHRPHHWRIATGGGHPAAGP